MFIWYTNAIYPEWAIHGLMYDGFVAHEANECYWMIPGTEYQRIDLDILKDRLS